MEGLEKYGRIGEAGRVTDRTVEEWQARRCMPRFFKERLGVAGMACSGTERNGKFRSGRHGPARHRKVGQVKARYGKAGMEPERRKHFGLSIQNRRAFPGGRTDRR